MNDIDFNPGALPDKKDKRDFRYGEHIGSAIAPFDWDKGYDIEEELRTVLSDPNFNLPVNDQGHSSSCGGQASSKKGGVVSALARKEYVEKSSKYPYAQVFVPPGGSYGRDLCNIAINQGWGTEEDTESYENDLPPTEPFMQSKQDITQQAMKNAGKDKAFAYLDVPINFESIAHAIKETKGVILGIEGQNNGTWRTKFPKPPTKTEWRHWVYAGKAKKINGKKYIGFINSWGQDTGEDGWQYIGEEYILNLFNVWTMIYGAEVPATSLFTRTLMYGMTGKDVKKLQQLLELRDDGIFGKNTLKEVKLFQTLSNLKPDGIVGKLTQAALAKLIQ